MAVWLEDFNRNNYFADGDPTGSDDKTLGYSVGSFWVNRKTGSVWRAGSVGVGSATWHWTLPPPFIGRLMFANMNDTEDQAIPLFFSGDLPFRVKRIAMVNPSDYYAIVALSGGIYTDRAKKGAVLIAPEQTYELIKPTMAMDLFPGSDYTNVVLAPGTPLYLSLSAPCGIGAKAHFYVYGDVYG